MENSTVSIPGTKGNYHFIDTRTDLYALEYQKKLSSEFIDTVREQAKAVGGLMQKSSLSYNRSNNVYKLRAHIAAETLNEYVFSFKKTYLSPTQRFINQPVPVDGGTAYLVSENTVLTAAHCVCKGETNELDDDLIKNSCIVLDLKMLDADNCQTEFPKDNVRFIKRVISHSFKISLTTDYKFKKIQDWAWLELDRKVEGIKPLKIDYTPVRMDEELFILGYPSKLPVKYATGKVKEIRYPDIFESDLDAFHGNSGSPVFRKILKTDGKVRARVVGMLIRGNPDYEVFEDAQKQLKARVHHVDPEKEGYEWCHRMHNINFFIPSKIAWNGFDEKEKMFGKILQSLRIKSNISGATWGVGSIATLVVSIGVGIVATPLLGVATFYGGTLVSAVPGAIHEHLDEKEKKVKASDDISKNMIVYEIEKKDAIGVAKLEKIFKQKFSPRKLLELLAYCKAKKLNLSDAQKKKVLKAMHQCNLEGQCPSITSLDIRKILT